MSHNFKFSGGDILRKIAASWFVSYKYYQDIDPTHMNWNSLKSAKSIAIRKKKYNNSVSHHKNWLHEVLKMDDNNLMKNTIGLAPKDIKDMAKKLI